MRHQALSTMSIATMSIALSSLHSLLVTLLCLPASKLVAPRVCVGIQQCSNRHSQSTSDYCYGGGGSEKVVRVFVLQKGKGPEHFTFSVNHRF
jgi:hypothetical protein